MKEALIEISTLNRVFQAGEQQVAVLKDIDLKIYRGEMVAIMGASGSGKSTLMNILGCLDRPSSGSYKISSRETRELDDDELATLRRNHFGFIFQRYHLLSHLDAVGNAELAAVYAGVSKSSRQERAHMLLSRLGLEDRCEHKPSQLSGGQQQRVSIARALMNGGEVILADEPTGALDTRSGQEVMDVLRELHQQGHTVIIVTHDPQVAAKAERIIEIQDGEIIADRVSDESQVDTPIPSAPESSVATSRKEPRGAWLGRFTEAFKMAWIAMISHRLRTLLTMLGIIIGITAVVSVVAIGEGAKQKVISDINSIGVNTIEIFPGKDWGDERAAAIDTLVAADVEALQAQPFVDSVTPSIVSSQQLRYRNATVNVSVNAVGEQYFRVKGLIIAEGRPLLREDIRTQAQVVVIDSNTRKKLFTSSDDPVGKVVLIGASPWTVIGVAEDKSDAFGGGGNLSVWMPHSSATTRLIGRQNFSSIIVRTPDGLSGAVAEQGIVRLLTTRHGVKDFFTFSTDTILKAVEKTTTTLTLLVSSIAVISLIVGGIGVMNIMLVSVTERTREIGIRMAVGARQSDILQQFLIEAVMVCLISGGIGILLSLGVGALFSLLAPGMQMLFSVTAIVSAVVCSSLIGVLFGFLPARNAARLDPIEALSRE
ncbi:MacB family efflux pump subunit [Spartinivicinus poritis]|uniref:MacB family efflux pump subunit n=1 Tax=Spartinivicinus poritis TaxID=2994640 RepID=A0ABT5U6X4_9GAMM|nr:MacB family efflux pump subunit [Spartinivicinus sp. A2-2]MDE1462112.1 MacB family efflux pump subunit [Spartinivicinus sp. A2-2]